MELFCDQKLLMYNFREKYTSLINFKKIKEFLAEKLILPILFVLRKMLKQIRQEKNDLCI